MGILFHLDIAEEILEQYSKFQYDYQQMKKFVEKDKNTIYTEDDFLIDNGWIKVSRSYDLEKSDSFIIGIYSELSEILKKIKVELERFGFKWIEYKSLNKQYLGDVENER